MKHNTKKQALRLCALFVVLLLACGIFSACSAGDAGGENFDFDGKPKVSDPEFQRTPPPFVNSAYVGVNQQTRDDGDGRTGVIDLTNIAKGYVAAASKSPVKTKFRVEKDGIQYTYDLNNEGQFEIFPLASGDGHYKLVIFLHREGENYEYYLETEVDVQLESEFAPFLVPNQVVNYTQESESVQLSYELAQHCSTDTEVVAEIYYWITNNITYDTEKANAVLHTTGYVPHVDEIMEARTGICYDYAAVAASMMRANGIPCKLIMGNVSVQNGETVDDVYHAWNLIWLEEKGWVAVKIASTPGDWQRIDTTFAASGGGEMSQFIGDGQNYFAMSSH